ncbi:GNAT family N-acetyltransferase [Nocardioides jensenii]|uniref:GNAT family N-acetyltransferase n=1 Tax=Nocardioides jensenii TaxID=1843 RepID=UPI00082EF973|nr:GNAT family N-acetyltransferase [Nocardioides jensenii]
MSSELTLRPAATDDLPGIAALYERVRAAAVPVMPPVVHSSQEIHDHVTGWDLGAGFDLGGRQVWVAETDRLVGFATFTQTWLDSLYVEPAAQGAGVGSALLELVLGMRPDGIALWVFESNEPARSFYRRHGFVELEHTDGSENEERSPDLRMAWPGKRPLDYLRGQIDLVDQALGHLLARRTALTAAVQERKPTGGPAGRDPAREHGIALRIAALAPALGVDRVARIVDAIITESLDAYEHPPE